MTGELAHLFNYAGKPWLSQYWVRQVSEIAYGDVSHAMGLGVGDEDQGQMGDVSALMSVGLFSIRGGCDKDPIYEITAPVFDQVTVHLHPKHYEGGNLSSAPSTILQRSAMGHPKKPATQHRKNNPRMSVWSFAICLGFLWVRAFNSAFVFAECDLSS